jgi:hypothetical protein
VVIGVQAQDVGQHITPGPASSTLTRGTTAEGTGRTCGGVGSPRGSLGVVSSPRHGWDAIAGGWSGRCRG